MAFTAFKELLDQIKKNTNPSLTELDMSLYNPSEKDVTSLANALRSNKTIISITNLPIGGRGWKNHKVTLNNLLKNLENNHTLTKLELDITDYYDDSQSLYGALRELGFKNKIKDYIDRNQVSKSMIGLINSINGKPIKIFLNSSPAELQTPAKLQKLAVTRKALQKLKGNSDIITNIAEFLPFPKTKKPENRKNNIDKIINNIQAFYNPKKEEKCTYNPIKFFIKKIKHVYTPKIQTFVIK